MQVDALEEPTAVDLLTPWRSATLLPAVPGAAAPEGQPHLCGKPAAFIELADVRIRVDESTQFLAHIALLSAQSPVLLTLLLQLAPRAAGRAALPEVDLSTSLKQLSEGMPELVGDYPTRAQLRQGFQVFLTCIYDPCATAHLTKDQAAALAPVAHLLQAARFVELADSALKAGLQQEFSWSRRSDWTDRRSSRHHVYPASRLDQKWLEVALKLGLPQVAALAWGSIVSKAAGRDAERTDVDSVRRYVGALPPAAKALLLDELVKHNYAFRGKLGEGEVDVAGVDAAMPASASLDAALRKLRPVAVAPPAAGSGAASSSSM